MHYLLGEKEMRGQLWQGAHSNLHSLQNVGQQASEIFQNQFVSNNSRPNDLIWGPKTDWNGNNVLFEVASFTKMLNVHDLSHT